jgi:choline oxidase
MPELVTVNPNITVMMIGEKCSDLVKRSRHELISLAG